MGSQISISKDKKFVMLFRYNDNVLYTKDKCYNRIFAVKDIVAIIPYTYDFTNGRYTYQKREGYNVSLTNKETIWINDSEYFIILDLIRFDEKQIDEAKAYMANKK